MDTISHALKYPLLMRILHWVIGLCILGLIVAGWYMTGLDKEDPLRPVFYGLHKSFGVLVLVLVAVRIVVRLRAFVPPQPDAFSAFVKRAAHWGHMALYLFMVVVPFSGYGMSVMGGYGAALFGIPLPDLLPENKALAGLAHEVHEVSPYILLALVVGHVLMVIKHYVIDRVNVLQRML